MNIKQASGLISRYIILFALALGNLWLIYKLANPATIKASFFFIQQLYPDAVVLGENVIFFKGYYATIIPACVAGAAYYLLFILNLTTQMSLRKRIGNILFLVLTFYIINLIRILVFAKLFVIGYNYFDITHVLTWYFGSTVMVVILWFLGARLFNIDSIPIYSDFKEIHKEIWQK
ncbi:MAG: pacearchaeosortase [Nanoarchaeota archaeon]